MHRRRFLQHCASAGVSLFVLSRRLSFLRAPMAKAAAAVGELLASPLQKISGAFTSVVFNGDDISRPHDLLWNTENYIKSKGGRPTAFDTAMVAVVGGGMSGLLSAYALRNFSPVLFEQAPAFGGNSKGEEFKGQAYSIGAAYVGVPDKGSAIEKLFQELGLLDSLRREAPEQVKVAFSKLGLKKFWEGETDPAHRDSFKKVAAELERIYKEAYPEIPWSAKNNLTREEFSALDRQTAENWLHSKFPDLHPHVEEFFQVYCWSSFGGSLGELSAAQFLNFVCSETQGVMALPGGNSAIGNALYRILAQKLGAQNLKSYSIVLEVKNIGAGVEILYEDKTGTLRLLRVNSAVVATPKYVARYIVKGLPAERDETWKELLYRAYAVVNVLLKDEVPSPGFDIFGLEGKVPATPTFGARTDRPWADLVFGGWANRVNQQSSILTLYKPYPFEGGRSLFSSEIAHKRIKEEVESELKRSFALLGIGSNAIEGIRITRWGHSLPLAQPGMVSGETLELLRAPHGKIVFANQDNYMNPAFESCFAAAEEASAFVRELIRAPR
jgi:hypothetical protein